MQAVGIKKVDAGEIFAKIDEDGSDEIDKMEFSKFFSLDENEALCRGAGTLAHCLASWTSLVKNKSSRSVTTGE